MTTKVILNSLDKHSLEQILSDWKTDFPDMGVFALLPEAENAKLPLLQKLCLTHDIPLFGGIFPALLTETGFITTNVWLFRLDTMPPAFILNEIGNDSEAGIHIALTVAQHLSKSAKQTIKPTLFMVFDALLPNIFSILDQLYLRLSDEVRYAGVNAGSESFQPLPCLFDNKQTFSNAVLILLLQDNNPFSLEHGYQTPEHMLIATSSEKNRIITIDWRPAFDVYQEIISREYNIYLNRENFYQYAVHFPFGILRANGEVIVRIPVNLAEDGSIYCVGEVPENAMLTLLNAPTALENHCIDHLLAGLKADSDNIITHPLLTFYCAGRRMHLKATAVNELCALKKQSQSPLLAGALSLGEIGARESDYPIFHNAALICKLWH